MATVDQRYQAKLLARQSGTTEVKVYPVAPPPAAISGTDPNSVDARYQAKLAARAKAEAEAKLAANNPAAPKKSAAELLEEAAKAEAAEKSSKSETAKRK